MTEEAVLATLDLLDGVDVWIGGGWGVDALVGRRTRTHDDLDVAICAEDEPEVMARLASAGFAVVTDWRPNRVALRHRELGEIDVHPIHFEPDGSAWLPGLDGARFDYPADGFTTGTIAGRTVACITADLQRTFHLGYEPQPQDIADMRTLAAAGLITLPEGYEQ